MVSAGVNFVAAFDASPDCFGLYSAVRHPENGHILDFRCEYVNAAACRNNRLTAEEQVGRLLVAEILPTHAACGLFEECVRVVETGEPLTRTGYDGNEARLERAFDIRVWKIGAGFDGFAAAWRDVTDRETSVRQRRASEERLRLATEGNGIGTWSWDLVTDRHDGSPVARRLLGLPPVDDGDGDLPRDRIRAAIHPEDRDRVDAAVTEAIRVGGTYFVEYRTLPDDSDGSPRWVISRGQCYRDSQGVPVRLEGVLMDITERKRTEVALRSSQERLLLGMQVAGMAIAEVDYQTGMNHLSAGAARLYGIGDAAVTVPREAVHATFHPDDRAELSRLIAASLDPNGPGWFARDHRVVWPDGQVRWLRVRKQVVFTGEESEQSRRRPLRAMLAALDVTEEKRQEEALRQHARRQDLLLAVTEQILGDQPGEADLVARVFALVAPHLDADVCFFYRPAQDALHLAWQAGVPEAMRPAAQRLEMGQAFCGTVAATGQPLHADAARIGADALGRFVRSMGARAYACHPLHGSDGTLLATLSFASTRRDGFVPEDVAFLQTICHSLALAFERRRADAELRESEAFNRTILENSPDCVKVLDADGRLQFMNANGLCAMEIDALEPLIGSFWWDLWPVEQRQQVRDAVVRAGTAGSTVQFQAFCPTAKGTPKWWDVVVAPILSPQGEGRSPRAVTRFISVSRDITESKSVEAELRASAEELRVSEERYRLLTLATNQLVWWTDADGAVARPMPLWEAFTGQSEERYRGFGWMEAIHPDDRDRMARLWRQALAEKRLYECEYRLRRHDGVYRIHVARAAPVLSGPETGSAVLEWIGANIDVTEQREAARRNERIAETLQRSLLITPDSQRFSFSAYMEVGSEYQAAWDEALIGGDFYDVFALPNGQVVFVVGDATGKGLEAAEHIAEVKYALRAFLRESPDPANALKRLNAFVCAGQQIAMKSGNGGDFGSYVAVAIAVLDPVSGIGLCSGAGMEYPILLRGGTKTTEEITLGGALIGAFPDTEYLAERFQLRPDDVLALVTDGVTESRRGYEFFGSDGFTTALREAIGASASLTEAAQTVVRRAVAFAGGKQADDMCLLLVRRAPPLATASNGHTA